MQNSDGGFGAFSKDNNTNSFIKYFTKHYMDSTELFDESCVDITAHVLDAWAEIGYKLTDAHVKKAVNYIKKHQTKCGGWESRWGVNYIYSIGAVVSALTKFKELQLNNEPWLIKSIHWLLTCQNKDGGFGESTLSYKDSKWIGKGISTPSQTAWAILALVECKKSNIDIKG